ncbi:MAG: hypothetical protein LC721_11915, partial [Actinobacteria bacterium]|nr:hypothetical protein [Actinomycetota bacterium]
VEPQLSQLVKEAPEGPHWLHEIKFDGYRMHARLDGRRVQLLTRKGLDWIPRITVDWDTSQADDFRTRGVPWTMKRTTLERGRVTRSDRESLA